MPVHYGSVLDEHRAVRDKEGWFDVSHLGRFRLGGRGASAALARLLSNDLGRIEPDRTQYTMVLNEGGGIVDDLIVWWWGHDEYWLMPNAANHARVMAMFAAEPRCEVEDLRASTAMVAIQGPEAIKTFEELFDIAPGRFRTAIAGLDGGEIRMAGTGYTGEGGGELVLDPELAVALIRRLDELGVPACGLGARDTLRLEAGLALWGEDIDETTTPLEAGLGFAVVLDRDFVGGDALRRQKEAGLARKLAGFVLDGRGVPRGGHELRSGVSTGAVTSGNMSPMLERGIGMGYMSPPVAGSSLEVRIRDRWVPASVTEPPFHKNAS